MPRQIVKQPDGKYAVFSTIVDHFVIVNATREEVIHSYGERQSESDILFLNGRMDDLDAGKQSYPGQGNWERKCAWMRFIHGEEEAKKFFDKYVPDDCKKFVDDENSEYNKMVRQCEKEREADDREYEERNKK